MRRYDYARFGQVNPNLPIGVPDAPASPVLGPSRDPGASAIPFPVPPSHRFPGSGRRPAPTDGSEGAGAGVEAPASSSILNQAVLVAAMTAPAWFTWLFLKLPRRE